MKTHSFNTTVEAYDACQCDENIHMGDLLLIPSENVVGIAHTWPFAVSEECGALHEIDFDYYDKMLEEFPTMLEGFRICKMLNIPTIEEETK